MRSVSGKTRSIAFVVLLLFLEYSALAEYGYLNVINAMQGNHNLKVRANGIELREDGYRTGSFSGPLGFRPGPLSMEFQSNGFEAVRHDIILTEDQLTTVVVYDVEHVDPTGSVSHSLQAIDVPDADLRLRVIYVGSRESTTVTINGTEFHLQPFTFIDASGVFSDTIVITEDGALVGRSSAEDASSFLVIVSDVSEEQLRATVLLDL